MNKDRCLELIELYGSYKLLWHSNDPNYTNKTLRADAWKDISEIMNFPVEELRKKMDSLLGSYRREKSRVKQRRSSGRDDVYTSRWYAYDSFQFMEERNNFGDTQDPLQEVKVEICDNSGTDDHEKNEQKFEADSEESTQNEQILQQNRNKCKRKVNNINEQEDDRVNEAFKLFKQCVQQSSNDPLLTYGQHIANELRKYDAITLAHVKNAINNIIFEADTGRFQQFNI